LQQETGPQSPFEFGQAAHRSGVTVPMLEVGEVEFAIEAFEIASIMGK
jgi:hypothetical protein